MYKAQGLTLDKAKIDLGEREISSRISYIAISRVRKIKDVALTRSYNYSRLSNVKNHSSTIKEKDFLHKITINYKKFKNASIY